MSTGLVALARRWIDRRGIAGREIASILGRHAEVRLLEGGASIRVPSEKCRTD